MDDPSRGSDEVHLWRASLGVPEAARASLEASLTGDELARANRFRFPRDRDRFVAARGLLRAILAGYLGRDPATLRFAYGAHGKPALADPAAAGLRFNLAHAGDRVLVAVGRGREVGVDLEPVRADLDIGELGPIALTARERGLLAGLPPERRSDCFAALWTRKEALAKATGLGLALRFDRIDVAGVGDAGSGTGWESLVWEDRAWSLRSLVGEPGFAAALAVEGGEAAVSWRTWLGDDRATADRRVRGRCSGG